MINIFHLILIGIILITAIVRFFLLEKPIVNGFKKMDRIKKIKRCGYRHKEDYDLYKRHNNGTSSAGPR